MAPKSDVLRHGYLILSEYGNIGGFFTLKSDAKEYFKKHFEDEKGYYIFECTACFSGKFFN